MSVDRGKRWRVFKTRGMWVVRRPGGAHHGAYITWAEANAQAFTRANRTREGLS